MKKLNGAIDRFCYEHPNFGVPNLMLYVIAANAIVLVLDMMSSYTFSPVLDFVPALIFKGQLWRILSFIIVPEASGNLIFAAISLYFYYWIGSSLERQFGTARFTIFYLTGIVCTIVVGLIGGLLNPYYTVSMYYVNISLFLAFASLYPDAQVLLMFCIPVKIKWLAYVDAAFLLFEVVRNLIGGYVVFALLPIVAMLNYLIYFGEDLLGALKNKASNAQYHHSRQTINFKKAAKQTQKKNGYIHKCCVCGRTDTDYPDLEFRYCSKCAGYRCYCIDHINNHVHIQ